MNITPAGEILSRSQRGRLRVAVSHIGDRRSRSLPRIDDIPTAVAWGLRWSDLVDATIERGYLWHAVPRTMRLADVPSRWIFARNSPPQRCLSSHSAAEVHAF